MADVDKVKLAKTRMDEYLAKVIEKDAEERERKAQRVEKEAKVEKGKTEEEEQEEEGEAAKVSR